MPSYALLRISRQGPCLFSAGLLQSLLMTSIEQLKILLKETGAVKTGEFVLSSGKKSNLYIDCRRYEREELVK